MAKKFGFCPIPNPQIQERFLHFLPILKISGRRIRWHYETHSILPWRSASLIIMKFFYKIGKQNLLLGLKVINCNLIFRFCFWPMISLLNTGWNENQWRSGSIHKHWLALFRLVINFHFEHSIMRYLIIGTKKDLLQFLTHQNAFDMKTKICLRFKQK